MRIQETVAKYAQVISKIAKAEVEIVDAQYYRVAGTGIFSRGIGEDTSGEAHVYRRAAETGRRLVVYHPGEEAVCKGCPRYRKCDEKIEIAMPILVDTECIGFIGVAGTTEQQRERILQEEENYLDLVEQLAEFVSAKAKEELDREKQELMLRTLRYTVHRMEQGALLLESDGRIAEMNEEARKHLEFGNEMRGLRAELSETGDRLGKETEYRLQIGGREYLVLGSRYEVPGNRQNASSQPQTLLLFKGSYEVREQLREIGAYAESPNKKEMVGSSPATKKLRQEIRKIAPGRSTVLITGESGTGKEVVAATIWQESDRSRERFIAINCAAIPEAILESELFGYVRGAFTGADSSGRMGKFELANKGVIFLDEIGDMPMYLQSKLLRVLQERKIVRIGSNVLTPIDVRVLAATNKDLKQLIREGKFREDLYYRLNVIPLHIEALRDRREDIQDLVMLFAARFSKMLSRPVWKVTDRAMEILQSYSWPGNVRELENAVEYMVNMMGEDGVLGEKTIPRDILEECRQNAGHAGETEAGSPGSSAGSRGAGNEAAADGLLYSRETGRHSPGPRDGNDGIGTELPILPLKEVEKREVQRALAAYGTSTEGKRQAARSLGISLSTLYRIEGRNSQGREADRQ